MEISACHGLNGRLIFSIFCKNGGLYITMNNSKCISIRTMTFVLKLNVEIFRFIGNCDVYANFFVFSNILISLQTPNPLNH